MPEAVETGAEAVAGGGLALPAGPEDEPLEREQARAAHVCAEAGEGEQDAVAGRRVDGTVDRHLVLLTSSLKRRGLAVPARYQPSRRVRKCGQPYGFEPSTELLLRGR